MIIAATTILIAVMELIPLAQKQKVNVVFIATYTSRLETVNNKRKITVANLSFMLYLF